MKRGNGSTPTSASQPASLQQITHWVLDGQSFAIPTERSGEVQQRIQQSLDEEWAQMVPDFTQRLEQRVHAIYAPTYHNIPLFTDWFYSLKGEYSRYLEALIGSVDQLLLDQLQEKVFQPAGFETHAAQLPEDLEQFVDDRLMQTQQRVKAQLKTELAPFQIGHSEGVTQHEVQRVELTAVLEQRMALRASDVTRLVVQSLASGYMGYQSAQAIRALMLKSVTSKIATAGSFKAASALLSKVVVKLVAKNAAITGAATAGLVCGPAAILCGAAMATLTWLAIDEIWMGFDEQINRAAFESELRQALEASEREMVQLLQSHYRTQLQQAWLDLSRAESNTSGTPASQGDFRPIQTF